MDTDKKIRISADAGQLESTFDRIKKQSQEMARGMLDDVSSRVNSSKELVKSLNEELRVMERIQSINVLEQRTNVQDRLTVNPNDKSAQKDLSRIEIEDKEGKIQNELLRDILEELKGEKVKELDEKERIEKETIAKDKLDQRIRKQGLRSDEVYSNEEDRKNKKYGGVARGYGMSVIGSRNAFDAGLNVAGETGGLMAGVEGASAKMIAAGIAITLAAAIGKAALSEGSSWFKSNREAYSLTGRKPSDQGLGYEQFGYSASDYTSQLPALLRARHSSKDIEKSAYSQMLFKRGIGLDEGTYADFDRMSLLNGSSGSYQIQSAISGLRKSGVVKGDDLTSSGDYLAIIANLGKEQLSKLGRIDVGMNTRVVAALSNMDETLKKSPESLTTIVNALQGGLSSAKSPQMEAIQLSVLKKINPKANYYELKEMQENALNTPGYLEGMTEFGRKIGGGNKQNEMLFAHGWMGTSFSNTRKVVEGRSKYSDIMKSAKTWENMNGVDLDERGRGATSPIDKAGAMASNVKVGAALVAFGENSKAVNQSTEALNNLSTKVKEAQKSSDELGKQIKLLRVEMEKKGYAKPANNKLNPGT